ncbi:MAG TPA: hypothetical protein VMI52_01330 [Acetobacteraceae bacterium]|nr:hypothetical protein [Acetobacteraceae bacterium]
MVEQVKVIVGGSLKDDLAAFRSAWERTERGEEVRRREQDDDPVAGTGR